MALWAGDNINSTETAMVFNQLYNRKSIDQVRKKNGALYAILGKAEVGSEGITGFQRMQKTNGLRIEARALGKLKTISTVSDGANEMATATLTNSQDYWGAPEFALAHYADAHGIPNSELDRFKGDELKTGSYIDEVMNLLTLSLENTWGTALNATGASVGPSRTVLGSLQHAVSDGVSVGETNYVTYGLTTRSDSGNADFRSYTGISTGDLTLGKIRTAQNTTVAAGGNPSVVIAHTTPYGKIQALVEDRTIVDYDEKWSQFGGEYVKFRNLKFVLDQRADSASMIALDPDSWVFYRSDYNFTKGGIVNDPSRVASYVLNWGCWVQPICYRPISNWKLTGITS